MVLGEWGFRCWIGSTKPACMQAGERSERHLPMPHHYRRTSTRIIPNRPFYFPVTIYYLLSASAPPDAKRRPSPFANPSAHPHQRHFRLHSAVQSLPKAGPFFHFQLRQCLLYSYYRHPGRASAKYIVTASSPTAFSSLAKTHTSPRSSSPRAASPCLKQTSHCCKLHSQSSCCNLRAYSSVGRFS